MIDMPGGKLEKKPRILIVDDEESIRFTLECFLTDEGYEVITAKNYSEAKEIIENGAFDMIYADIILGGGKTGLDIIREAREKGITRPVVIITGAPTVETAVEAARLGVFDYIPKPIRWETLVQTTKAALEGRDRYRPD
jgi:DNA-binding NtrC family response regulator